MGNLTIWLTPIWILSLGVTLAAAAMLVIYGVLWVVSRRTADAAVRLVRESVLQWVSYVVIVLVVFSVIAIPVMPAKQVIDSLKRLPAVGEYSTTVSVPAHTVDLKVPLKFNADELQSYSFASDQDLVIGVEKGKAYSNPLILVEGHEAYNWSPSSKLQRLFTGLVDDIYVTNESDSKTDLAIKVQTDVPLVEVRQIPTTAVTILAIYGVYFLMHLLFPGVATIALATSKEAVAQPLYLLALVIGACLLVLYIYIPYNTFGEDVKMFKDSSLMTIMVLAILVAVWTASVSVADEIEGRTALTLLSKPISRREFVLGKFLGITWANCAAVFHSGRVDADHGFVQGRLRRPRNLEPRTGVDAVQQRNDQHCAGAGAVVYGSRRADGDQRGDFDAAADSAQPGDLRLNLRAGPFGPADRAVVGRTERVRGVFRQADCARSCPCSTTSTFRLPWQAVCACRRIISRGRHCIAFSIPRSQCCWR